MSNVKLKEELDEHKLLVEKLNARIGQLVDRQKILERELEFFKKRVELDMGDFKTRVGKDLTDVAQYIKKNRR